MRILTLGIIRRKLKTANSMDWQQRRRLAVATVGGAIYPWARRLLIVAYFPAAVLLARFGVRFLASQGWPSLGQLAFDPQVYTKGVLVGAHRRRFAVLIAPPWLVANMFLLDLWRSHLHVVSNPIISLLLFPFTWTTPIRRDIFVGHGDTYKGTIRERTSGRILTHSAASDEILRLYDEEYDETPLVSLRHQERECGQNELAKLGVPQGAWWACLHIRESGYHNPYGPGAAIRDSNPESYLDAVKAIIDRGGWVLRIGDSSMRPLPKMDGLVDYVHSNAMAPWRDMYLMEGCRFLLGTDSGPQGVARLFSRPAVIVNLIPMGHGPITKGLHIPKLYRSVDDNRLHTFEEIMKSPSRDYRHDWRFERDGIRWQDNTAAEIRDVTVEMMDRLDGTAKYDSTDTPRLAQYRKLLIKHRTPTTFGIESQIGRDFLRKNASLLPSRG